MKSTSGNLERLDVVSLWALFVSFERRLASELGELGLTVAAFRLIGEVMNSPDGIRQSELARRLGVRAPTVSSAIGRLEARGFVYRLADPTDPRARRVHLAPEAPLSAGVDVLLRMDTQLFGGLPDGERLQARELMQKLSNSLGGL